ncbi:MAG TPA: GntR family transcriptional regulator [Amycolatopsis sp.]|nr:GntR family transcriptional regulator [Amycolatopsis sp.]
MHQYARIATELQRRIAAGELRPGDRVPSTRQITQEWGVAMATATKVLNTLRQEGLVRAVQGVGTVVASPDRTARREPEPDLSRDRIVAAGLRIADSDGLAGVSMRRIATELGTATMSLYRHVPGKDDLVVLMADAALTEEPLPAGGLADWRARLELLAHLQWRACHRHPWLSGAIPLNRPQAMPSAMRHTEWALRALAGPAPKTRLYAYLTLVGYVRGAAAGLEAETRDMSALAGLTSPDIEFDIDELFEFGLGRMLDGLAPLFEHSAGRHSRRDRPDLDPVT